MQKSSRGLMIQSKARFAAFLIVLVLITAAITGLGVYAMSANNNNTRGVISESRGIHTQWC